MGLHDRPYWKEPPPYHDGGGPRGGMAFPKPGKAITWLLIINAAVYILEIAGRINLDRLLGAIASEWWQIWRYLTFQFLHDTGGIWHIVMNMLGLYMLGTPLEQLWGGKRFLRFYLCCGAAAGITYVVMAAAIGIYDVPIIGASGGVCGLIMACALLFPRMKLMIYFVLPVSIRVVAIVIFGVMILVILSPLASGTIGPQFWSDVAHLGGAAAAAVWIWGVPKFRNSGASVAAGANEGPWQRKMQQRADRQAEIDRILDKIHDDGIASLTKKEKKLLQDATKQQQEIDRKLNRL